jgi:hypothetical protein
MIAGTSKRLLPDDIELLKKLQKKYLLKIVRSILLFGLFLGLFILSYHNIIPYEQSATRASFLLRGTASVPFFTVELKQGETVTPWLDPHFYWLLLGFGGAYLAMFPLCSLLVTVFAIHSIPRVFSGWDTFILFLLLLVSIAISLIVVLAQVQFHFVHLALLDTIVEYLFCIALFTNSLMLLVRHILPLPPFRQAIRQVLIGVFMAVFLYFTAGQLLQLSIVVTGARLLHGGILFVFLWLTYLFYEECTRSWQEKAQINRTAYVWLISYIFKVLFFFSLLIILFFLPGTASLHALWPAALLLILFLEGCCSAFYKKGRAAIAGATVSALIMAFALVTLFPFIL